MTPIVGRHFWNEDISDEVRREVGLAFQERVGIGPVGHPGYPAAGARDPGEAERGVVQVDFLGAKVVFEGLVRGKNGMFEMKLRRVER